MKPLERFLHVEAASGLLLIFATAIALAWANSPWAASYHALWHTPVPFGIGPSVLAQPLHFWINDGLMTLFFLLVGLEIRREMHAGALSNLRLAALPAAAALGGIIVPAVVYLAFNSSAEVARGWAIPTATDIAFAVGVLALLGPRVPQGLRVLLLALAIIDDIAAVVVIALFYSEGIAVSGLALAAFGVVLVLAMQRVGIRNALAYILPGVVVWIGLLQSGVHPTLSGVILGLLTPVRAPPGAKKLAPVARVEAAVHPWVAYGIMPLFAFANAGVALALPANDEKNSYAVAGGIVLALALGKPIGIVAGGLLALETGLGELSAEADRRGLLVVGCLGGIGFTMSIFIADLAFSAPELLASAKLAILMGSAIAAIAGLTIGRLMLRAQLVPSRVRSRW